MGELVRTEITPELAAKLLLGHWQAKPPKRYIDPENVAGLAQDMIDGEFDADWRPHTIDIAGPRGWTSSSTGVYVPPGTIMDGFHRLNAVCVSGVTITAWLDLDFSEESHIFSRRVPRRLLDNRKDG